MQRAVVIDLRLDRRARAVDIFDQGKRPLGQLECAGGGRLQLLREIADIQLAGAADRRPYRGFAGPIVGE